MVQRVLYYLETPLCVRVRVFNSISFAHSGILTFYLWSGGAIFVKSTQGLSLSSNTLFPPLLKGTFSRKLLDEEFELGLSLIWEDPMCGFSPFSMVYLELYSSPIWNSVVLLFEWTVHKSYPDLQDF